MKLARRWQRRRVRALVAVGTAVALSALGASTATAAPPANCQQSVNYADGADAHKSLYSIAKAYGTTVEWLQANDPALADAGKIQKGQPVCVKLGSPADAPATTAPAEPVATTAPADVPAAPVVSAGGASKCPPGTTPYDVPADSTMWSIAKRYGITIGQLAEFSSKANLDLMEGEELCVPTAVQAPPVVSPHANPAPSTTSEDGGYKCGLIVDDTSNPNRVYRWFRLCPSDLINNAAYGLLYPGTLDQFYKDLGRKHLNPGELVVMSTSGDGGSDDDMVHMLEELFLLDFSDADRNVPIPALPTGEVYAYTVARFMDLDLTVGYPLTAAGTMQVFPEVYAELRENLESMGAVGIPATPSDELIELVIQTVLERKSLGETLYKIQLLTEDYLDYNHLMEVAGMVPDSSWRLAEDLWEALGHDPRVDAFGDWITLGSKYVELMAQTPPPGVSPEDWLAQNVAYYNEWIKVILSPPGYDPNRPMPDDPTLNSREVVDPQPVDPCGDYSMCDGTETAAGTPGCESDPTNKTNSCAGVDGLPVDDCVPNGAGSCSGPKDPQPVDVCTKDFTATACDPTQVLPGACNTLPGTVAMCEFPVEFPWLVNCNAQFMDVVCTKLPEGVKPPTGSSTITITPLPVFAGA